jgi:membrane protease YdiL (CAAX protease family)
MSTPGLEPVPESSDLPERLRGFGPTGIIVTLVVLLAGLVTPTLGAVAVLVWVMVSRTPWSAIGYVRPRRWVVTIAAGIAVGVALKLVMKSVVMPLLGAPAVNPAFHFVEHNPRALPDVVLLSVLAGFGEETYYRGWMFERLGRLLGGGRAARIAIVLGTSLLFAVAHYPGQKLYGAVHAFLVAVLIGSLYAATRRIPFVMVTHMAFDLTAFAIIYLGLEARIAHLFFRPS